MLRLASLASLPLLLSCASASPPRSAPASAPPSASPASPDRYASPSQWLCLPGRNDACAGDLTATVLHADGTRTVERSEPAAAAPKADCFYVYPTVDVSPDPGNHDDFRDLGPMSGAVLTQVARLRSSCAIYAPLYRQVTIGSYFHPDSLEPRLATAFSDVEAAFREYLAHHNNGRPIVLVGHSQGADMVIRLLQRFFDHDDALRSRLVLALPVGWYVEVPKGKTTGATFESLPICTSPDEAGCVLSYRSYEAAGSNTRSGGHGPKDGDVSACVNPAAVGSDALTPLSRTYFRVSDQTRRYVHTSGIDTPFVAFDRFYQARCTDGPSGVRFLAVSTAPGDARQDPVQYPLLPLHKYIGLHVLDLQLAQGDLMDLVARHVAALR
ncbi:MAG TPA: DUF3089 domain-containing protein [Polyangiaceae bacterium]|jgi:pimeloyl-ACP methyl ester carboxylesterase